MISYGPDCHGVRSLCPHISLDYCSISTLQPDFSPWFEAGHAVQACQEQEKMFSAYIMMVAQSVKATGQICCPGGAFEHPCNFQGWTFKYEDLILLHLVYFQLVKVGDGSTKTWNYEVKPFTCVMNLSLFFIHGSFFSSMSNSFCTFKIHGK